MYIYIYIYMHMNCRLEAGESPASGKTHAIMRGTPGSGPQLN